jgi:hypothetical protein
VVAVKDDAPDGGDPDSDAGQGRRCLGRPGERSGHLDDDLVGPRLGDDERDDVDRALTAPDRPRRSAVGGMADPTGRGHGHVGELAGRSQRPTNEHSVVGRVGEEFGSEPIKVDDPPGNIDRGEE